jgi:hypothetical protein
MVTLAVVLDVVVVVEAIVPVPGVLYAGAMLPVIE